MCKFLVPDDWYQFLLRVSPAGKWTQPMPATVTQRIVYHDLTEDDIVLSLTEISKLGHNIHKTGVPCSQENAKFKSTKAGKSRIKNNPSFLGKFLQYKQIIFLTLTYSTITPYAVTISYVDWKRSQVMY